MAAWRKKGASALPNVRSIMSSSRAWKAGLVGLAIVAGTAYAVAQMPSGHVGMHGNTGAGAQDQPATTPQSGMQGSMHDRMMQLMQDGMMRGMHGGASKHTMMGTAGGMAGQPSMPGQDAFGAIREVVQILEADPATDWSKVNISTLREHLIDMNEVTLHASASEQAIDNGVEISVTGQGRTIEAIKRMVPAHVGELARIGWNAKVEELPDGVKLTVTTNDPKQVAKLKALGFMGIMVQGDHHQRHHLTIAKGDLQIQ
jgi:hypothetical protein